MKKPRLDERQGGVCFKREEIEKRKTQDMKEQNITEQKAWWMATKELIAQSMK